MAAVEGTHAAHDEEPPTPPTLTPPPRRPADTMKIASDIASADAAAGRVYRMRLASWETDGGTVIAP